MCHFQIFPETFNVINFDLKMGFVIWDPFPPSIPPRGVVLISPLFNFRRKGKYRLLEQRRNFTKTKIKQKRTKDNTTGRERRGKRSKITNLIFKSKFIMLNISRETWKWHLLKRKRSSLLSLFGDFVGIFVPYLESDKVAAF